MYGDWLNLVSKLAEHLDEVFCPNCGKHMINYLYIGDEKTRMGYLQIWCESCLTGIYVSRVKAPEEAKMIFFDQVEERDSIIPDYLFINE